MAALTSIRLPDDFESSRYVEIVDQLRLPHDIVWQKVSSPDEAFEAIKSMKIRGAPAIASLAALSIACDLLALLASATSAPALASLSSLQDHVLSLSDRLVKSRPTAVNLREALSRIVAASRSPSASSSSTEEVARKVVGVCKTVWSEDVERNHAIGDHGAAWFLSQKPPSPASSSERTDKLSILTVCNTGSLATSGYGTALGVITSLFRQGRLACVYYMATSPYFQGSRLTSLELKSLGIPNKLVSDTAAAWLIASGAVDGFVCGADRVAANGDTANKISTYQLALLCRHAAPKGKRVPVAVAAPLTTLDLDMASGEEIVIEHRPAIEACTVRGKIIASDSGEAGEGATATVLVTPEGCDAVNPAFDVTPAELIDGIVTELGVASKPSPSPPSSFDLRSFVDRAKVAGGEGAGREKGVVDLGALNAEVDRVKGKYAAGNAAFLKNAGHGHPLQTADEGATGGEGGGGTLGGIAAKKGTVDFGALRGERDRVQAKYAAGNAAFLQNTGRDLSSDLADRSR